MALLWAKQTADCHYEVRSAGQSVRLYSNGVFHSQWNPNRVFGDAIWDLLALPAIPAANFPPTDFPLTESLATEAEFRVLVLGVGGGAVIRQLLALHGADSRRLVIEGVDLDPHHLMIAKQWFGLAKYPDVKLSAADAVKWVANFNGARFDLVIDDLFGHHNTEVNRSVAFDSKWAGSLAAMLTEGGAMVINNADRHEFKTACRQLLVPQADVEASVLTTTSYGVQLTHPRYDNRILVVFNIGVGAVGAQEGSPQNWRQHWRQCIEQRCESAGLPPAQCRLALSYLKQARRVFGD